MKFRLLAMVVALPLALAACQTTEKPKSLMSQGWFPINSDQLSSIFPGNTLESEKWNAFFSDASSVTLQMGSKTMNGKWEARDNQWCRSYDGGAEKCFSLHRRGAEVLWPNGTVSVLKDGNTKGL